MGNDSLWSSKGEGARANVAAPRTKSIWNSNWRTGRRPGRSSGKTFGNSLTIGYEAYIGFTFGSPSYYQSFTVDWDLASTGWPLVLAVLGSDDPPYCNISPDSFLPSILLLLVINVAVVIVVVVILVVVVGEVLGTVATGKYRFSLFKPADEANSAFCTFEIERLAAHKLFVARFSCYRSFSLSGGNGYSLKDKNKAKKNKTKHGNGKSVKKSKSKSKSQQCMQTRSSSKFVGEPSTNPTFTIPNRRNRRRSKQRVEPFSLEENPVDRFKDLHRACPHHDFTELHQLDTFYNALTPTDQDSLNAAVGGNLLTKTPWDALTIIENKLKVRNSRNKPIVQKMSTNALFFFYLHSPRLPLLSTPLRLCSSKSSPPASVKAVEEICVYYGVTTPYPTNEYAQEVLGFSDSSTSGNPTPSLDHILSTSSPSLIPFEEGDFILEEIEACLTNDSFHWEDTDDDFDPEGDLLLLEKLLNDDPSSPLHPKELHVEELKIVKSSIDDPPGLELK
ncbi:hypothetical protein Tco_1186323 [Tanacetum coccineum]